MICFGRSAGEGILIQVGDQDIVVMVNEIYSERRIRLGVQASGDVKVHRLEIAASLGLLKTQPLDSKVKE